MAESGFEDYLTRPRSGKAVFARMRVSVCVSSRVRRVCGARARARVLVVCVCVYARVCVSVSLTQLW